MPCLDLSWAWEPMFSLCIKKTFASTRSYHCLPYGDKEKYYEMKNLRYMHRYENVIVVDCKGVKKEKGGGVACF